MAHNLFAIMRICSASILSHYFPETTFFCACSAVLWQASPVSRPADLVLWSGGSAPTSCIMSQTVHHCPCVSDTVARCGTCSGCHCSRVNADTPLTALRRDPTAPSQDHELTWLCMCMSMGIVY